MVNLSNFKARWRGLGASRALLLVLALGVITVSLAACGDRDDRKSSVDQAALEAVVARDLPALVESAVADRLVEMRPAMMEEMMAMDSATSTDVVDGMMTTEGMDAESMEGMAESMEESMAEMMEGPHGEAFDLVVDAAVEERLRELLPVLMEEHRMEQREARREAAEARMQACIELGPDAEECQKPEGKRRGGRGHEGLGPWGMVDPEDPDFPGKHFGDREGMHPGFGSMRGCDFGEDSDEFYGGSIEPVPQEVLDDLGALFPDGDDFPDTCMEEISLHGDHFARNFSPTGDRLGFLADADNPAAAGTLALLTFEVERTDSPEAAVARVAEAGVALDDLPDLEAGGEMLGWLLMAMFGDFLGEETMEETLEGEGMPDIEIPVDPADYGIGADYGFSFELEMLEVPAGLGDAHAGDQLTFGLGVVNIEMQNVYFAVDDLFFAVSQGAGPGQASPDQLFAIAEDVERRAVERRILEGIQGQRRPVAPPTKPERVMPDKAMPPVEESESSSGEEASDEASGGDGSASGGEGSSSDSADAGDTSGGDSGTSGDAGAAGTGAGDTTGAGS